MKLIEVIGPAGAGKSTLAKCISGTGNVIWHNTPPYFRRAKDLPFFTYNTLLMLPTLLRFYKNKNGKWFTSEEIAWMVILNGWSKQLIRTAKAKNNILLLDEGPIFHLAYLNMLGPDLLHRSVAVSWWQKMYSQVARITDLIIWLDAPNEVLLHRIRARKKLLVFATKTDEHANQFLDMLRKSYEALIPGFIQQKNTLKVLRFDTGKMPIESVVKKTLSEITVNA